MNRNQWSKLSISSWFLMILFIGLDLINSCNFDVGGSSLGSYDVWCIINGEIYEPFIYLFFALGIIFMIISWLEPKKK